MSAGIMDALKSVGVEGADLCVAVLAIRFNPEKRRQNSCQAAAKTVSPMKGLSIPLVTNTYQLSGSGSLLMCNGVYAACGGGWVSANLKVGYWHWSKEDGRGIGRRSIRIRQALDGFSSPLCKTRCSAPVCTNHSGDFDGG